MIIKMTPLRLNPGLFQLLGGIVLSTGYVHQIVQLLRTKKAEDLNLLFMVQVLAGILCMQVYAIHLWRSAGEIFFLITNSISLGLSSTVISLKIRYRPKS